MSQMCPNCSFDNLDEAQLCTQCSYNLRGLLGANTVLSERYQVFQVLGYGAMGAVYLAQDNRLTERRWAIKENRPNLHATATAQSQSNEQFLAEANTLARLDHAGLPKVSDYFIEEGREYLVMDYVEGQDLANLLLEIKEPLTENLILSWADQALDALVYLHGQSPQPIIHRDIKPANFRLTSHNKIKLVDFGLVKLLDEDNPGTKTDLRGVGTPAYAPLEQFAGSQEHTDARSDVYSLGATLYHLVTNLAPPEVHHRLLEPEHLIPPQELNETLSEHSAQIIAKAMAIHPNERYQSAVEMRQAVAEARQALASPSNIWTTRIAQISPWLFGAIGLILVLIILGGIGYFVFGAANETPPTVQPVVAAIEATATATITEAAVPEATNTSTSTPTQVVVPTATDIPVVESTATSAPTPTLTLEPTATATASAPQIIQPRGIPASSLVGTIAYPVFTGDSYNLYFGQADGSGTRLFRTGASQPSFSRDGRRIAFRSWTLDNRGLLTMNVDGSEPRLVTKFVEDQLPTWSADGSEIILLSRRSGDRKSQLIKVNSFEIGAEGTVIAEGEYPTLGPNDEFVFKAWGITGLGLMRSSIALEPPQNLTGLNEDTAPAISPDGQKVVFMSRRENNWDIFVMNIDGSEQQRLTENPAQDGLPTWSPDGQALAFVSDREGQWAMWAMTPAGDDLQQLFALQGSPDGFVGNDNFASRGWAEERISWTP